MQLATRTVGSGSRTAALVHGASMSTEAWRDFGDVLLDRYDLTLLLVDQRGHGRSPRAESYRIREFADDLVETLPRGLDLLIGQSLGGLTTAMAAAELAPRRYIGIDPALAIGRRSVFLMRTLGPLQVRLPDRIVRSIGVPPDAPPDTLSRVRTSWSMWDTSMSHGLLDDYVAHPWQVAPPAVPSTVVLAEKSFVVPPKTAEALRAAGWDVRVKPGAVHDMHIQDPAGLVDLLADVLAPIPSR